MFDGSIPILLPKFKHYFKLQTFSTGARCKRSIKRRHSEGWQCTAVSQTSCHLLQLCMQFLKAHMSRCRLRIPAETVHSAHVLLCLKVCGHTCTAFLHRCRVPKSSQQDFSTGLYFRHQPVSSSCVIVAIVTYFTVKCIPFFLRPLSMSIKLVMKSVNFCHSEVTDASSDFKHHAERLHLKSQLWSMAKTVRPKMDSNVCSGFWYPRSNVVDIRVSGLNLILFKETEDERRGGSDHGD